MRKLLGLLLALALALPVWPQAQPTPSPTPTVTRGPCANHDSSDSVCAHRSEAPPAKPAPSPTPQATAPATAPGPCSADYYRNSDGVCVHRPVKSQDSGVPQGATAQCRDGSYSFSQHRSGTCSHHGGVAKWL
jgi:Protein of unknown function (DUF3761)